MITVANRRLAALAIAMARDAAAMSGSAGRILKTMAGALPENFRPWGFTPGDSALHHAKGYAGRGLPALALVADAGITEGIGIPYGYPRKHERCRHSAAI